MTYVPARGDVVWLSFSPQAGREQAGRRPAVILSPEGYNDRVSMALCCPVTSKRKGYPFEVPIPGGFDVHGVILADQVRNLDWRARRAELLARLPASTLSEVIYKVWALISDPPG